MDGSLRFCTSPRRVFVYIYMLAEREIDWLSSCVTVLTQEWKKKREVYNFTCNARATEASSIPPSGGKLGFFLGP